MKAPTNQGEKIYEKLPLIEYNAEHYKYEQQGLNVPDGSEVVLTDWAIQNGLGLHPWKERKYFKVKSNYKKGLVGILPEGNKTPSYYWAGFWKQK